MTKRTFVRADAIFNLMKTLNMSFSLTRGSFNRLVDMHTVDSSQIGSRNGNLS